MAENKSRLSRMRNVRVNAAGLLRRAPSFLPETTSSGVVTGGGHGVAGVGLTRSNSSSSTFYVQLPAATAERKPVVAYLPVISSPSQPLWQQRHEHSDSETSGCESGRLTRHVVKKKKKPTRSSQKNVNGFWETFYLS